MGKEAHLPPERSARLDSERPHRSPRAIYREQFADARRERLFLSSIAFFLTFATVRAITYTIHAGRGPLHDVVVGGMHLHHLVLGILLLLGSAISGSPKSAPESVASSISRRLSRPCSTALAPP